MRHLTEANAPKCLVCDGPGRFLHVGLPAIRARSADAWTSLALALHALVAMTALAPGFSARPIANRLAGFAPQGIAVVGTPCQAEFNFAARLTVPVATPAPDELSAWKAAHPGGVVAGPVAKAGSPDVPSETFRFRGQDFGLWPVQQAIPALLPPVQSLPNR